MLVHRHGICLLGCSFHLILKLRYVGLIECFFGCSCRYLLIPSIKLHLIWICFIKVNHGVAWELLQSWRLMWVFSLGICHVIDWITHIGWSMLWKANTWGVAQISSWRVLMMMLSWKCVSHHGLLLNSACAIEGYTRVLLWVHILWWLRLVKAIVRITDQLHVRHQLCAHIPMIVHYWLRGHHHVVRQRCLLNIDNSSRNIGLVDLLSVGVSFLLPWV